MVASLRRAYRFVQAYICLLRIHRALRRGGFAAARQQFLRPWKTRSRSLSAEHISVREIEQAVDDACAWQWQRSVCLHRALAAYCLLRSAGTQPQFIMAVMSRPFASHAWTQVEGRPVADKLMDDRRHYYKPTLCIPQQAGDSSTPAPTFVSQPLQTT